MSSVLPPQSPHSPKSPPLHDSHDKRMSFGDIVPSQTVDFKLCRFGDKNPLPRRSSLDWEAPNSKEGVRFAFIDDNAATFSALIDLDLLPNFSPDEIDVQVHGYDVVLYARKQNAQNPNSGNIVHREYRLPEDIDLDTLKLHRVPHTKLCRVDAKKAQGYGKNVAMAIFDVTNHNKDTKII